MTIAPRTEHAAAVGLDGRVYISGGRGVGSSLISSLDVFDPATGVVTSAASLPVPRSGHVSVQVGGLIYVIGGQTTGAEASVLAYDPGTNAWTARAGMSVPRYLAAGAVGHDGRIYVAGGWSGSTMFPPNNSAEVYDPATDTWSPIAAMSFVRSLFAMATGPDGRIYAMGGSNGSTHTGTVEAYDPATNAWTAVASLPATRTFHAAATGLDGGVYAIGGYSGGVLNGSVVGYDVTTNSWTAIPSLATPRRLPAAATGLDGQLYAIGGEINFLGDITDGEAYPTQIVPPTPEEAAAAVGDLIASLVSSNALSAGAASSLMSSIAAVQAALERGNTTAARGELGAFINKANALVRSRRLSASDGAELVAAAQGVLDAL